MKAGPIPAMSCNSEKVRTDLAGSSCFKKFLSQSKDLHTPYESNKDALNGASFLFL